jgi:hypothetical protein
MKKKKMTKQEFFKTVTPKPYVDYTKISAYDLQRVGERRNKRK